MGFRDREVEVKLLVTSDDASYGGVNRHIRKFVEGVYPEYEEISGNSYDLYWKTSKKASADFVRLRRNESGAFITMKATDRGDNVDRVEVDLQVDNYNQAKNLLTYSFPDDPVRIKKKYNVYFLENSDTTISVYTVEADKEERVFVEVEARSLERVQELVAAMVDKTEWEYAWSKSSLFNLFVENKEIRLLAVERFLETYRSCQEQLLRKI